MTESSHETAPFVPSTGDATTTGVLPSALLGSSEVRLKPAISKGPGRVALIEAAAHGPDAEMVPLLRRRLRQLVLLFLAAYAAFLTRDLFSPERQGLGFQRTVFFVTLLVHLVFVATVWSTWANTIARLRALEWGILIVCWSSVGFNQFEWLSDWNDLEYYIQGKRETDGQILIANTWVVPWFALIACYPVIVPNTARRALLLTGIMTMIPCIVTIAAMVRNPMLTLDRTWMIFVQYAIWFTLAVGIASYGAYQATLLRRQAYEARRFGQYKLAQKLGAGGMGEVYLAEHLLLKRPSVIKTIRPERARDPAILKRFEREVQILATLTHPNTVAVFDYGYTADGTFYYVMEYLPGFDLETLVRDHGPLPAERAVHLLRQVCFALREAHAAGLIHRDVKPGNVMVCQRGGTCDVAKLLDFGLVQSASELQEGSDGSGRITREGMILGTPAYMSPEQAAARPLDGRSDVYSLGATAYFLLCGKPPFHVGGAMEIIAAQLLQRPKALRDINEAIPPDVAEIVARCLAKDPDERFTSIDELEIALRSCACTPHWDDRRAGSWWVDKVKR